MLRRSGGGTRRAAFTLIELIVVIAIIATLMGLLMSAVMRVLVVRQRAETTARMTAINNAHTAIKGNTSLAIKYIPPGRFDTATRTWQPFRLRNSYSATPTGSDPGLYSFEAQYIIQALNVRLEPNPGTGTMEIVNLGWPGLDAQLDANQTLTFFLTGVPQVSGQDATVTGFSTNAMRPFAPRATPTDQRRTSSLDLGGSRKYEVGSNGFLRLVDAHGMPFAYFAPLDGVRNKEYGGYNDTLFALQGTVRAYGTNGQFENADSFQLISSGRDKKFGASGNMAAVDQTGTDDQSNFSTNQLGAGK
jgi:prepilin-type N-terminal cleavage/methylation domain-containing protein